MPFHYEHALDYYQGKIDGLKEAAQKLCECCDYEMPILEQQGENKVWVHGPSNERILCKAQEIQFLRKYAEEKEGEAYLNKRYGNMWHHRYQLKESFRPYGPNRPLCYCCDKPVSRRIDANIWGCVCEYDMCEEHTEQFDGKCCDSIPSREEDAKLAHAGCSTIRARSPGQSRPGEGRAYGGGGK